MEFSDEGLDDFLKGLKVKSHAPIVPEGQITKRQFKRIMHRNIANRVQSQQEAPIDVEVPQRNAVSSPNSQEIVPRATLSQKLQKQTVDAKRDESSSPEVVAVQFNSTQEKKEILKIFQSKAFVFIPYGIVFTKKQIDILSENIRKRGGKTFEVGFFDWKPLSYFDLMIITSNQMPHKVLLQTITEKYHKFLDDFVFVDYGWIAKCIQENSLLDHGIHTIHWVQEIEDEIEVVLKKPARDIYATRHQMKGGNIKRLKRNVGDTEALDLYLEEEKLELEALALEAELVRYPIKKMKKNVQVLETCRFLYDYSVGGQMKLVMHEDDQIKEVHRELSKDSPMKSLAKNPIIVQIEDEPSSPRTEILSVSDEELVEEAESDMKDYTKRLAFTQKMEVEDGETQDMSVLGAKVSPDFKVYEEYDESVMPKQEFLPNYFVLDSDEDEENEDSGFEFLEPAKNNKEANKVKNYNDPMLKGVEMQDEEERVKLYRTFNPLAKGKAKYWDNKKNFFVCEVGTVMNHNVQITTELEKLQKVYTNEKDQGRMFAYRKALAILKSIPFKIESPEDIKNLTGIGTKIKDKIQEIVSTGKLKKAEILTKDIKQVTIEILSQVWGIGVQTAIELFHKGLRTIDDLRRNTDLLNDNQKVGLKYFDDFQKRMSRDEVTAIVKIVEAKIEELAEDKLLFEVICCGSYRRGKPTCGDIDILITRRDGKSFAGFLQKLVKSLEGKLLTDHLTWPKPGTNGNETYMGVCKNGGLYRRIDIKIYPREQFGYAVLYFTGSDYFNRSMRLFARKKGLTLSDHGLYPSLRNKQEKVWTGQNIPCFTEEEVFTVLGLTYRLPSEREV